jgi:hypothetical protein
MNMPKQETKIQVGGATLTKTDEGLCRICIHEPYCTYKKNISRPVLQCEECECQESTSGKNVAGVISSFSPKLYNSAAKVERDTGKYSGLCENCEDRDVCVYPKPEGGVWHCEEYK